MPIRRRLEKTRGTACFSKYSVKEGNGPSIHGVGPPAICKLQGEESLAWALLQTARMSVELSFPAKQ